MYHIKLYGTVYQRGTLHGKKFLKQIPYVVKHNEYQIKTDVRYAFLTTSTNSTHSITSTMQINIINLKKYL